MFYDDPTVSNLPKYQDSAGGLGISQDSRPLIGRVLLAFKGERVRGRGAGVKGLIVVKKS